MLPSTTTSSTTNNALFLVGGTGALGMEVAKGLVTARGLLDGCISLVSFDTSDVKIARLRQLGWTAVEFARRLQLCRIVELLHVRSKSCRIDRRWYRYEG